MNPKESTEPMSIDYTPGPLLDAARNTPTALWNDSADPDELRQSISFGGVGATCNPTIAYTCINQRKDVWLPRIAELAEEMSQLIYWTQVMMLKRGLTPDDIYKYL